MALMPDTTTGKIEFCEGHITPWTTNATAIGTTAAAVTDLDTKTQAARTALEAQQAAKQTAKSATLALQNAVEAMLTANSAIISQIRGKAKTTGNSVYELAQIPAPAIPSPIAPPGEPYKFTATLDKSGALMTRWLCDNPAGSSGTIYQVWRRIGAESEFTYIGGTGSKEFLDATIPPATTTVLYKIQAVRSTAVGPWAEFVVNFSTSSGTAQASVTQSQTTKIAA